MAKIQRGAKNSSTLSSNLSSKSLSKSKYKLPSKPKSKTKSTKKRPSYKEEYVKLLERTNKLFTKEIKSIRKAITIPDKEYTTTQKPTFPVSGKGNRNNKTTATINDILEQLIIIESQITQRDVILNDLMGQSGKISTDVILNDSMENKVK